MVKSRDISTRPIHVLATHIAKDLLNRAYDECDTVPKVMIETLLNKRFSVNRLTKHEAIALINADATNTANVARVRANCQRFCQLFEIDDAFDYVLQFILVMNAHEGFCEFFI